MATRCAGVTDMVGRLSAELYRRIAAGRLGAITVMFARYRPGAMAGIETRRLLPLDDGIRQQRRATQPPRSEEHTSELQSLMRISYAVFCLKTKNQPTYTQTHATHI